MPQVVISRGNIFLSSRFSLENCVKYVVPFYSENIIFVDFSNKCYRTSLFTGMEILIFNFKFLIFYYLCF